MDQLTAVFVEGMGAAAATSGVLTKLEGRIFGFLYMQTEPRSLDDITQELQQSKSNVSVQVRNLVDWQLVRQVRVPGSRKDHYEAATDFWRVMREVMERRMRWNLRQVTATAEEALQSLAGQPGGSADAVIAGRLTAMRDFFGALDLAISATGRGEVFVPDSTRKTLVRIPIDEPTRTD